MDCDVTDGGQCSSCIGWERIGAAAIQTPVVHVEEIAGAMVLRLGAVQGAWYGWGNFGEGDGRIDTAALRDHFRRLGALEVVDHLAP